MGLGLIIALDFNNQREAVALLDKLDPSLCAVKIGNEMFTLFGTHFVSFVIKKGFRVFLDLKFHDIPNTVARACAACAELGVWMINVHALGGLAMMQAAATALKAYGQQRPLLIAVTLLTSMLDQDLVLIGINSTTTIQVQRLAQLAYQAGLDGVVCSVGEVTMIKKACKSSFLTITPGIRLAEDETHDQARVFTPSQAKQQGSDYLVIGRSITHALDPIAKLTKIVGIIA